VCVCACACVCVRACVRACVREECLRHVHEEDLDELTCPCDGFRPVVHSCILWRACPIVRGDCPPGNGSFSGAQSHPVRPTPNPCACVRVRACARVRACVRMRACERGRLRHAHARKILESTCCVCGGQWCLSVFCVLVRCVRVSACLKSLFMWWPKPWHGSLPDPEQERVLGDM
jgi:hypothetical protein